MTTWSFNRKGFRLYARAGFRVVPNTSVELVNFLPTIWANAPDGLFGGLAQFVNDLKPDFFRADQTILSSELLYRYEWRRGQVACTVRSSTDTGTFTVEFDRSVA